MTNKIKSLATVASLITFAHAAQGSIVLAEYDFTGGSLAATTELYTGSAGSVSLGVVAADNTAGNLFISDESNVIQTNINVTGALFTFSYTVTGLEVGETLSLDSASIDYTNFGNTVRVDFTEGAFATENPATGDGTFTGNLTSVGLTNGDVATIRFGMRDNVGATTYTFDNLVLNGTVVPEPSSYALLVGLAGLGFAMVRRRRA